MIITSFLQKTFATNQIKSNRVKSDVYETPKPNPKTKYLNNFKLRSRKLAEIIREDLAYPLTNHSVMVKQFIGRRLVELRIVVDCLDKSF